MKRTWFSLLGVLSLCGSAEADVEAWNSVADPAAVVTVGRARFTVLTPELIRMEYSPAGRFEDRASYVFVNRRLPVPRYTTAEQDGLFTLRTDRLELAYRPDAPFSKENLSIRFRLDGRSVTWTPGMEDKGNLRGTYRTLDGVSGGTPLPPGLLSRDGWVLVDDSRRILFDRVEGTDWPWVALRTQEDATDWYFFGYGRDYQRALGDYVKVAGRIPLVPRYAFGVWWSRYWAYTEQELRDLVKEFQEHQVPLDVLVIDMDWHLDGWTGYTWNPKYFPDPEGFMKWAKQQGLKITLNLHPADGVGKHEAAFPQVARHMGLDPEKVDKVPFDCTDPRYVEAYFKYLHHPLERQGVDFWWMDWQQGTSVKHAKLPQVDPLPWLNYLHWTDMERSTERPGLRPMFFSRWGDLGSHRYQIGFSGDTYCNWPSLAFQPYFTSTAGNVAYPFWTHDIGGHMPGEVEPELYTRWVQWGAFSPILRTHTAKNPAAERRIWKFPPEHYQAMKQAFELRYALLPYIYTAARQCYDTAIPLCRPLYYEWPELPEAYEHPDTYLFGDQFFVAPVLKPVSAFSGCARLDIWLPPGEWIHWFTGQSYKGPRTVQVAVPLDEIPLFVRGGGIIPAQPPMRYTGQKPVDPLILHVWPGPDTATRVYEDDGLTQGYRQGECVWTPVSQRLVDGVRRITIGPAEGSYPGMLAERAYEIRVREAVGAEEISLNGEILAKAKSPGEVGWSYDSQERSVVVLLPRQPVDRRLEVTVKPAAEPDPAIPSGLRGRLRHVEAVLGIIQGAKSGSPEEMACRAKTAARWRGEQAPLRPSATLLHSYLGDLAEMGLDEATHRAVVARLLGLDVRVAGQVSAERPGELECRVDLGLAPVLGEAKDASARLRFIPPVNWRIEGGAEVMLPALDETRPAGATVRLAPEAAPQTAMLAGELELRVGPAEVLLRLEQLILPSINRFWVVGPFPAKFADAMDVVCPPEQGPVDVQAAYASSAAGGEKLTWRKVERALTPETDLAGEFVVDFIKVFGKQHDHAIAYAYTILRSPRELEAVLALGSDDGVAVWLNGQEVFRRQIARYYRSKEERVPIRLKKGDNALLLKVTQNAAPWKLAAHIETAEGRPIPEVTAWLTPPEE